MFILQQPETRVAPTMLLTKPFYWTHLQNIAGFCFNNIKAGNAWQMKGCRKCWHPAKKASQECVVSGPGWVPITKFLELFGVKTPCWFPPWPICINWKEPDRLQNCSFEESLCASLMGCSSHAVKPPAVRPQHHHCSTSSHPSDFTLYFWSQ